MPDLALWQRASHAQIGKGFDRAKQELLALRGALDAHDPIEAVFLAGAAYLLDLVYTDIEYQLGARPRRDYNPATNRALDAIHEARGEAMRMYAPTDRAPLPERSFAAVLYLRARGVDARHPQRGPATVPHGELEAAMSLWREWADGGGDVMADARRLWRG